VINIEDVVKGFKTPEARWARFGPYYAMFPVDFAFKVVEQYSRRGDFILDPFAGRCSSIYAGGILGRHSLGIEINPVGWLYGSVKIQPAEKDEVIDRLLEIYGKRNYYNRAIDDMPEFYRYCYCDEVLKFLLAARGNLNWKTNYVDATLMSILLVYLHGKIGEGLSNQMQMTKAMGMSYSVKWWKSKKLYRPPIINPVDFVIKKLDWRYEKGIPKVYDSKVLFGDSTVELESLSQRALENGVRFSLLFTSPPYYSITDYHDDQWLRLWLLGEPHTPAPRPHIYQGRFGSQENYYYLLDSVFGQCAPIMSRRSTIYVRTDKREFTLQTTLDILSRYFPKHNIKIISQPFTKKTQTEIHGNTSSETGEVDIIMQRN
jgi:hypothetical protein